MLATAAASHRPTLIQIAAAAADIRLADLLRISDHLEAEGRLDEAMMMEVANAEMEVDALRLMDEAGMTHPHEQVPFTPEELAGLAPRKALPRAA